MRRFVLVVAAGLVLAACGSGGSEGPVETTEAPTSSTEARLPPAWAIQVVEQGRATIQTVDADGGSPFSSATTVEGGDQTNPDWSPDGTRIAFGMNDGSRDDLWITDFDGTGQRKIFDCEDACDYIDDPAWSPDGGSVAVCILTADGDEHLGALVSIDVATGETTTLFAPDRKETFCAGPRWSPDGRRIVLELVDREDTSLDSEVTGVTLTVLDLSAEPVTTLPLTDPALFASTADWNRDGDLIVYSALPDPGSEAPDLYTIGLDGSGLQRRTVLSDDQGSATEPSFDPDGATVVFVSGGVLSRLDLETDEVTSAFDVLTRGNHPRARPSAA